MKTSADHHSPAEVAKNRGGDWWSTPHRPTPRVSVKEQRAAARVAAREAARDRAKCPKHHRDAANAAAKEVRERLAPWAHDHQVKTAWPTPRTTWGENFHAMCYVRKRFGVAHVIAEAQAPTLAGALDALTAALRAMLAKGEPIENRWSVYDEHAEKIYPGMPEEEFARIFEKITGHRPGEGPRHWTPPVPAAPPSADLVALGLRSMPTRSELKAAWHAAAKRHHPDAGGRAEDFTRAREAYERLQRAVA